MWKPAFSVGLRSAIEPDPISKIKAVCFDTFGTLVEIADKRRPCRASLQGRVKDITIEEVLAKLLNLRDVAVTVFGVE
jgi:hypothetical protein